MFNLESYLLQNNLKVVSLSAEEEIAILLDNKETITSKEYPELLDYSYKKLKEIAQDFKYTFEEQYKKVVQEAQDFKSSINSILDKFLLELEEVSSKSTLDDSLLELLEKVQEKTISAEIFQNLVQKEQQLKLQNRKTTQQIYKDTTTTALNKSFFDRFIGSNNEFRRAEDFKYYEVFTQTVLQEMNFDAMMCIDLNNFKNVNDTYGHDSGDEVMRNLVKAVEDNTKRVVIRNGGDEFCILGTKEDLEKLSSQFYADEFLSTLNGTLPKDKNGKYIATASCGIASFELQSYKASSIQEVLAIKEQLHGAYKEADEQAMVQKSIDKANYYPNNQESSTTRMGQR